MFKSKESILVSSSSASCYLLAVDELRGVVAEGVATVAVVVAVARETFDACNQKH